MVGGGREICFLARSQETRLEGFATPLASSSSACLQAAALILIRFFHERPDYELRSRVPASLKQDERWANTGYPLSPTGDLKIDALDVRVEATQGVATLKTLATERTTS